MPFYTKWRCPHPLLRKLGPVSRSWPLPAGVELPDERLA